MLSFSRAKILAIWIGLIALSLIAVPSFIPEATVQRLTGGVALPRINLGLDLSGGSHLLLEAETAGIARTRIEQMESTVEAEMRRGNPRIEIGDISTSGGRLSFMVRDSAQVDAARERIQSLTTGAGMSGQRDWDIQVVDTSRFILTPTRAGLAAATDSAMEVATEVVRRRVDELGTREPSIVREGADRIVVQVPGLQDPQALKALLGKTAKLEFRMVAGSGEVTTPVAPAGVQYLPYQEGGGQIAVERRVAITGDELTDATQGYEQQTNAPVVNIRFDSQGGRKFANLSTQFTGRRFAIIVDNTVISAPSFNEPIPGGNAQISGSFTVESANELAIALRSGKLPVDLNVIEESTVRAELGQDSIRAGIIASAVAAIAVIIFMLVTYGRFGVYANLAVVINILVILGVMSLLGATLTLPGIAGFVLTIGTAVDANVLINERIREERRRGRSVIQSFEFGYKEASRTIFEANVTHAIAGFIMLALGSGPVKGFAIVLLIGIATSVFTAVTFTRMLVSGWLRTARPSEIHI